MICFDSHPRLFTNNRERFIKCLDKKSVAVFAANEQIISNGDALYPYKHNSDLYWLTGITQDNTLLILCPDYPDKDWRQILFIEKYNELKEKWDGKRLTRHEAQQRSGIEHVLYVEEFTEVLTKLAHNNEILYLNSNENDRKPNYLPTSDYRFIQDIKQKFPLHALRRSAPLLKSLRGIKTPHEIEFIQKAIDITHDTFLHILNIVSPHIAENKIEGEIISQFLSQKARPAYNSIIASGANACILHYIENNQLCQNGDLILLDFGASYSGYAADLTRTIPVNGKFSPRQKEVYNACLNIHNYAKSILKPGITLASYTAKVGEQATQQFIKIGLLSQTDVKNQDKKHPAYRKYLYHGISHHLGVDVHDLGDTLSPIKENMLFTVEPGIYIAEEKMGVRIENNVWIKKRGNVDLMKKIPITVDEIEAYMQRK